MMYTMSYCPSWKLSNCETDLACVCVCALHRHVSVFFAPCEGCLLLVVLQLETDDDPTRLPVVG